MTLTLPRPANLRRALKDRGADKETLAFVRFWEERRLRPIIQQLLLDCQDEKRARRALSRANREAMRSFRLVASVMADLIERKPQAALQLLAKTRNDLLYELEDLESAAEALGASGQALRDCHEAFHALVEEHPQVSKRLEKSLHDVSFGLLAMLEYGRTVQEFGMVDPLPLLGVLQSVLKEVSEEIRDAPEVAIYDDPPEDYVPQVSIFED